MPPAGFEPDDPASERSQAFALDRAATGIGYPTDSQLMCNRPHLSVTVSLRSKYFLPPSQTLCITQLKSPSCNTHNKERVKLKSLCLNSLINSGNYIYHMLWQKEVPHFPMRCIYALIRDSCNKQHKGRLLVFVTLMRCVSCKAENELFTYHLDVSFSIMEKDKGDRKSYFG